MPFSSRIMDGPCTSSTSAISAMGIALPLGRGTSTRLQRGQVFAEVAGVADVDRVALAALEVVVWSSPPTAVITIVLASSIGQAVAGQLVALEVKSRK